MASGLKIHTQMEPARENAPEQKKSPQRGKWKGKLAEVWRKSAPGDRLLRSTSIACALLLGVMALRNADLPWTQRAVSGIEQAMTMKIDLDETLGKLHFVREMVPETALVFWNAGSDDRLQAPIDGQIEHAYSDLQPWRVYVCADGSSVRAALDGKVAQVEKGAMADHIVLISHDNGLETVYAYMSGVSVGPGDEIRAGEEIGVTSAGGGSRLYFAVRLDGEGVDPGEYE